MIKIYAALGLIVAIVTAGLYIKGLHSSLDLVKLERDNAQAVASDFAKKISDQEAEFSRVNSLLLTLENKEAEVRTVEKFITKEVVKYKDRIVNRCELSADWVCIANASAAGVSRDCGAVKVSK